MIRQPIISVMGHVDHGKTSLLDRIRNTAIASKESGRITQHIGASEVPISVVNSVCADIPGMAKGSITLPGLLFIDTPGHEAFTNLRKRGGSVADLAIVVVDIMQGFQPQTIEAINILKEYKTPFIIAANKIDLITGWRATKSKSYVEALSKQSEAVRSALDTKLFELIGRLSELGFNSELYSRVENFQKELAIVPLSAKTGEGIAELLMLVSGLAQRFLEMKLNIEVNGPGKGSILEKKEEKGLGTTIDVILYDGTLRVNDQIAFATADNKVVTTKIRALLKPKPLHEMLESTSKFYYVDEVNAASGIKISAVGLEDAMPGSPIMQAIGNDYAKEITTELSDVFKVDREGIVLKADSIGSIEAISKLLASENFRISKKGIGSISKRDIIDAFGMLASNPTYAVVMAFNVQMEDDAKEAAASSSIKVISSDIIYKLVDDYKAFVEESSKNRQKRVEESIAFPAEIEVLPNSCFRASHPAIFGIEIKLGRIRPNNVIMNDIGEVVGKIRGIQNEKSPLQSAKKGDQVAVSMDEPSFGRQVREGQTLYVRVSDGDQVLLKGEFSSLLADDEKDLLEKIIVIKKKEKR
ncbi:translation initiation factor IF-2 [Candidatus Marsarchaeota archaeon]|jgi:translation initiation factor 5B|nr:translation initiation factor IF-2 [Candidatus Marsarchaeota archaeon]